MVYENLIFSPDDHYLDTGFSRWKSLLQLVIKSKSFAIKKRIEDDQWEVHTHIIANIVLLLKLGV